MILASTNRWLGTLLLLALPVSAAENGARVTGTVRLRGTPPSISQMTPGHDTEVCGEQSRPLRALTLGTNQTVAGAIVYLGAAFVRGVTGEVASLELRDCALSPRVQVVKAATAIKLTNSDPVLHVVRLDLLRGTNAPQPLATVAAPYAGFEKRIALPPQKEPALLRMSGLNGHEWLTAYVAVLPYPWVTLSDTNGQFTLTGVQPGAYRIYAWHEALGTLAGQVNVRTSRATTVDLEFTTVAPEAAD
jgi:hypothetical protein